MIDFHILPCTDQLLFLSFFTKQSILSRSIALSLAFSETSLPEKLVLLGSRKGKNSGEGRYQLVKQACLMVIDIDVILRSMCWPVLK